MTFMCSSIYDLPLIVLYVFLNMFFYLFVLLENSYNKLVIPMFACYFNFVFEMDQI